MFTYITYRKKKVFPKNNILFIDKLWNTVGNPSDWEKTLLNSAIVSNNSYSSPLIISEHNLYLNYLWKAQKTVSSFIICNKKEYIDLKLSKKILQSLLHKKDDIDQKIAIALSMIWKIIFIIGGPGTGKTTTVAKILLACIRILNQKVNIQLAAPTGKAANKLTTSLQKSIKNIPLNELEKNIIKKLHAVTLHRLLGIKKNSNKPFFNENNLLNINILIIDEASMISLTLMEQLIKSCPKQIKIIFLGDINQLPSIEPGCVLKDTYYYYKHAYSHDIANLLHKITGEKIQKTKKNNFSTISDSICILNKNYRFDVNSDLQQLSIDLILDKKQVIEKILNNQYKNIFYYDISHKKNYYSMIKQIIIEYSKYLTNIKNNHCLYNIIKKFNKYRVLCAIRNGIYGVKELNLRLEIQMKNLNLIKNIYYINNDMWYEGKPIIITENNNSLELLNGDIGITLFDYKKRLKIFFIRNENLTKSIPINLITTYETAWIMTIHKSQGSEFSHTVLILPNKKYEILTHELLYTGITRARKKLTIYANYSCLKETIQRNCTRYSNLYKNNISN
ncbi:exodeoxyribonuclease V subunit alpha [Buchnera aphidicola (Formosaphis micheliae)]|uniref:exodeoxyribonuclease V subunit alpha n=1 Tax=Buchnera aphidicola TaxID=9 RepID=UPI0031B8A0D9